MDALALATFAIIVAATVFSAWKRISYSIIASTACVLVFILEVMVSAGPSGDINSIAFFPADLKTPERFYTVLTSMFAHASFMHIFLNVLALFFLGMVFEQRIGAKPFIVLFLLSGFLGTLAYAISEWGSAVGVVGASGAICGILGGFARLFPNERMSMIMMFFPLPPMPIWIIVVFFVGMQFMLPFLSFGESIAWQAHLGGLVGGILLAPIVVKALAKKRERRVVSATSLHRLATTPELRKIYHRIEDEEIPDVRSAWIEEFLNKARCPVCGSRIAMGKDAIQCKKGHLI